MISRNPFGAGYKRLVGPRDNYAVTGEKTKFLLDARSPSLLDSTAPTTGNGQSMYQPFPSTAAALLDAYGNPAGWTTADIGAIYLMENSGNQLDSLGLGPALVPNAFGWLTARNSIGLETSSFSNKTVCESIGPQTLTDAGTTFGDINGTLRGFHIVWKCGSSNYLLGKYGTTGWLLRPQAGTGIGLEVYTSGGFKGIYTSGSGDSLDLSWRCTMGWVDDTANKQIGLFHQDGMFISTTAFYTGTTASTGSFAVNAFNGCNKVQIAYLVWLLNKPTMAMLRSFWKHANAYGLNYPCTYTQTSPAVSPISGNKINCAGASQVLVGYHPNLASTTNPLGTGIPIEAATTYLGLNNTLPLNTPGSWLYNTGGLPAFTDAPNNLRDAIRVVDTNGTLKYVTTASGTITGASNKEYVFGISAKQGGVGTSAKITAVFGKNGTLTEEEIPVVSFNANLPADWNYPYGTTASGTASGVDYWGKVGASGVDWARVALRLYPTDGVAASVGTVDFAEPWGVYNQNKPPIAHCRTGAATATTMNQPVWRVENISGDAVWVANRGSASTTKFLASTGLVQNTYTAGTNPEGCCYDGTNVWISNYTANNISKFRATDGLLLGTYSCGNNPRGCCFDGTNIWVANYTANTVTKLLAADGTMVGTYATGLAPEGVCFDGENIWITNSHASSNSVTKLLASTGALVGTYATGANPWGCCFDGTNIWIANSGAATVTVLLASTGALVNTYAHPATGTGICFDGTNIWVTNGTPANTVSKLLASDGSLIGTYATGAYPFGCCFDGTNIWIANYNGLTVTKLLASTGALVGTYATASSPYLISSTHRTLPIPAGATATYTPSASALYDPAKFNFTISIAGFQGAFSATVPADFIHCGPNTGDAGRFYIRANSTGLMSIVAYNSAGAIAAQLVASANPDTDQHTIRVKVNAANGTMKYYLDDMITPAAQTTVAAWTPAASTAVQNIWVGSYANTNPCRCWIEYAQLKK